MLSHEDIVLRPLSSKDTEFVLSLRNDIETSQNYFSDPPVYDFQHQQWLSNIPSNDLEFIIEWKKQRAGRIFITGFSFRHGKANFGITLVPDFRGKGIAKKASSLLIQYVFYNYPVRKISLEVFSDNIPAISLYKSLGFEREGELREEFFRGGRWRSVVLMALFKEQWKGASS